MLKSKNLKGTYASIILTLCLLTLLPVNGYSAKLTDGRKTVSSAGTPEALSNTSNPCDLIFITGLEANTDVVVVGPSDVDATEATRTGTPLLPLQTAVIPYGNTISIFVDVEVNGEGVSWNCIDR